jgi:hypothetical protein
MKLHRRGGGVGDNMIDILVNNQSAEGAVWS